ncbi:putative PEP-binding protein [Holospora curviuscula]|uniref:Pyruvate, phosphate dikinase n=1 Tax=Holospora curviuscula TaxID=1082868 RepID=A0A2S5R7X2_9PROT|nr:putative PEP-binding protein [Holospora curviuscula]PPE03436.1 Pyruvate, phosphate dikinase [Holospora curviuscula]
MSVLSTPYSFTPKNYVSSSISQDDTAPTSKAGYLKSLEALQVPVPPFFVISYKRPLTFEALQEEIAILEKKSGKLWNDVTSGQDGLFVSVRSSFKVSMPGMLDSLLNVGLSFNHARLVNQDYLWRSYVKLIRNYAYLVEKIDAQTFPELPKEATLEDALKAETIFQEKTGYAFPQNANEQLIQAMNMVHKSWDNPRAQAYRLHENIGSTSGVDVIVQTMVFGNLNSKSGTGILFTRNPSTGEKEIFGEYSRQVQGEEIVSGSLTPSPLQVLEQDLPCAYKILRDIALQLEYAFLDMQDIEFTIENGKLWILQTRSGKRTKTAELRILIQYVEEGILTMEDALRRLSLQGLEQVYHPYLEHSNGLEYLGKGLGASPGAVSGILATRQDTAIAFIKSGKRVIFAAQETHCDDVASILGAAGVITATGGMTCHGAVVTRGLGKPCVTSLSGLKVHQDSVEISGQRISEGTALTIDGTAGTVWKGEGILKVPEQCEALQKFLCFSHRTSALEVYVNADTPEDWKAASAFNPKGVGLCRSEHMFFQSTHLSWFQGWVLGIQEALCISHIRHLQEEDYTRLLRQVQGKCFTVRLLDPPLHEFLPHTAEAERVLAQKLNVSVETINTRTAALKENNPMLGQRGCRLGIVRPELYDLQVQALFKAAVQVHQEGIPVDLRIMVPFVMIPKEFIILKQRITQWGLQYNLEKSSWMVGVMIEIPSAALQACDLAQEADFICFGTNDLTQMVLGVSRDDTAPMIQEYQSLKMLSVDPFQTIHQASVGKLISLACEAILKINPHIPLSVCGEHGGDPESMRFFHTLGIQAVSCSAYRIAKAYLAGAQIMLEKKAYSLDTSSLQSLYIA